MENTADMIYEIANTKAQGLSVNNRELKQRRGQRQRERQKSNRFRLAKQQLGTCITLFLYISLPSLHDYNVKMPKFTFCRGREYKTTFFLFSWTLIQSFRIQLQKPFANIWRSKRDGISAIKFEAAPANSLLKWWRFRSRRCCLKLSNIRLYQLNPKRTWREVEDVNLQDTEALIASRESTSEKVLFEWLHHGKRFTNLKMYDISSELTVMLKGFLKTLQLEIESPSKCFCPECDVLHQRNTFYRNQLKRNHFRKERDKK